MSKTKKFKIHSSILFLVFLVSFVVACFVADSIGFNNMYLLVLLVIPIICFFKFRRYFILSILIILGLASGVFWYKYNIYKNQNQNIPIGESAEVYGQIINSKEMRGRYLIAISSNSIRNDYKHLKFYALTFENPRVLNDKVSLKGEITKINKDNFLYKSSKSQGIFYEIKNSKIKNIDQFRFKEGLFTRISNSLKRFGDLVDLKIKRSMPQPEAGFISGILIGQKSDMDKGLKTNLSKTGTTHLIALSGFNITIVISFILFIFKPFPRKYVYPLTIIGIIAFVMMTGFSASIVRAALMGSILIIAKSFGRLTTQSIVIAISAFLISIFNPLSLRFDIGFQLSFLATLGLVYLAPLIEKSIGRYLKNVPKILSETLILTFSAQIMVLPILILYFNTVSIVSPITNLIIVPLIPGLMILGFIQVVLSFIWIKLGIIFGYFTWICSHIVLEIINGFASLGFASIKIENIKSAILVPYYILILINITYNNLKNRYEKQSA